MQRHASAADAGRSGCGLSDVGNRPPPRPALIRPHPRDSANGRGPAPGKATGHSNPLHGETDIICARIERGAPSEALEFSWVHDLCPASETILIGGGAARRGCNQTGRERFPSDRRPGIGRAAFSTRQLIDRPHPDFRAGAATTIHDGAALGGARATAEGQAPPSPSDRGLEFG